MRSMRPILSRAVAATAPGLGRRAFATTPARAFAKVSILGNLGDAPYLVVTSTGREIVKYSVASNSGPREERRTSWFKVTGFVREGPARDRLLGLQKGSLVYVEGDAEMVKFVDKEGVEKTALNIVQRNLEIVQRRREPEQDGEHEAGHEAAHEAAHE